MKVGLALGGGGARGLCFIEFCKAMDELGVKPSIIAGTSIGAIIGAFYAKGIPGYEMEKFLRHITLLKIPRLVDFSVFGRSALLKGRRIEAFIRTHLRCDRFEDLQIPFKITATDYWKREPVVIDHGPLIPAIRASMSLPAIFEPVQYENRFLIDGGAVNPLPIDIIRDECDYLIAIDVAGTIAKDNGQKPGMFECIMSTYQIMQNTIIQEKMKHFAPDLYVHPRLVNFGILDFHHEKEIRKSVRGDVYRFKRLLKQDLLKKRQKTLPAQSLQFREVA